MSAVRGYAALLLAVVLVPPPAFAHLGSPDVFFEGKAGPYQLLIAIRPPDVIPGVARVEVRSLSAGVKRVELTAIPMEGEAARHPPVPDVAESSTGDPQYFEGSLWLMAIGSGSWKVRIHLRGDQGEGELQIPVPTLPSRMKPMSRAVTYFLFGMMAFLTVGMVALVGAGIRESRLEPGVQPNAWNAKTIGFMAATSALLLYVISFGNSWWAAEASAANQRIYRPPAIAATLTAPDRLAIQLTSPGWILSRDVDDLAPDHGHLMHLFLVKWPEMNRIYHLHPDQKTTGYFETGLPSLPAGTYRLYGDIVHETGFSETATGEASLPDVIGKPLSDDDAGGVTSGANDDSFALGDGYRMVWIHDKTKPVVATALTLFSFTIVGPNGQPAALEPYMGMGGHAAFFKRDGTVFAHIHPSGSVSMASAAVASRETMMGMHEAPGATVSFPYGPPSPGRYLVLIQLKHAGKIETGAFALTVK